MTPKWKYLKDKGCFLSQLKIFMKRSQLMIIVFKSNHGILIFLWLFMVLEFHTHIMFWSNLPLSLLTKPSPSFQTSQLHELFYYQSPLSVAYMCMSVGSSPGVQVLSQGLYPWRKLTFLPPPSSRQLPITQLRIGLSKALPHSGWYFAWLDLGYVLHLQAHPLWALVHHSPVIWGKKCLVDPCTLGRWWYKYSI